MATKNVETAMVECRVLSDCTYGNWGEVVKVEKCIAEQAPFLDSTPEAVAYAKAVLAEQPAE